MPQSHESRPACSVVIPTCDRPTALTTCLGALSAIDYPRDRLQVIVVDDGSTTDISSVANRFLDAIDLTVIRQANAGPAAARNTGIAAAKYEWIAFTDDDCAPQRQWLAHLMSALRRHPDALVGGACHNALADNPYATVSQMITDVVRTHFNPDPDHAVFFPSYNMAASRWRLLEIGGFDPGFRWSEDRDLCDRWSARGWPLIVAPAAVIDHAHHMRLWGFVKQHFGYGRGAWRFHRARARRHTGALEVEGSFYLKCFREPFRTNPWRRAIPLALALGVWQVANTAGFLFECARDPRCRAPRRPALAPMLQFTKEEARADG